MLSKEQNDLLTLTGPGTPGGDMMRRYWHPVALSEELNADTPVPVTVMSEELVLFRGPDGTPQLIGRFCPHRSVDLSYGRVEAGGLRCIYHGWVMDGKGRCLEQPGEPASSSYKDKIRTTAYPCREAGGLILAYMGPDEPPRLPNFDFVTGRPEQVFAMKVHQGCNYLQASEGNVDPQHLSFLHVVQSQKIQIDATVNKMITADVAPTLDVAETPFGHRIQTIRKTGPDTNYVRITNFIMPNCSAFEGLPAFNPAKEKPDPNLGYQMHYHVPISDTEHWKYTVVYRHTGALDQAFMRKAFFGEVDATYHAPRNRANRFLQSREEIRNNITYAGLGRNFYDQDTCAVETQGPIMDRSREHLGTTDRPVMLMRRQLLKAIDDVRNGRDPLFVERDGGSDAAREIAVRSEILPATADLKKPWWRDGATQGRQLVNEPAK